MNIMDFFPYESPRPSQLDVLSKVQAFWNYADVFVIRVPVAGGKSAIATTIQDWCLSHKISAAITVPNNMLRDQYMKEFDWLRTLKAQQDYYLPRFDCTVKDYLTRNKTRVGPKGCEYNEDLKVIRRVGSPIVMNFMGYLAHKLYRNVMIVDEAHQLLNTLQAIHSTRIWHSVHNYPLKAKTAEDLIVWLESKPKLNKKLRELKKELGSLTSNSTLEFSTESRRGIPTPCINLTPMNVTDKAPLFWPAKTKKLVLMSATINDSDIENMGLGTKKICYIDAKSEIPEDRRPIYYTPVGSMSFRNKSRTMHQMVARIMDIVNNNKGKKGFIHVTYELGAILAKMINDPRFIFHTQETKKDKFKLFTEMNPESGAVFVGAGMAEGIDLKYLLGEYQIITKIPFKSLANPCYRYLATNKPKDYIWLTSRDILQASGRICRTPEDYGATYILDADFDLWFPKAQAFNQIPEWFNPIMT